MPYFCSAIWCKLNSARNNRFILGNLFFFFFFATNKNISFWKGKEIQLLLRGSASWPSWVAFCVKFCCLLLPLFFLMPRSPCHCKEMTLCLMQLTFLNSLPDWLAKDTLRQSSGHVALLPDSLLKNTSEEREEGEKKNTCQFKDKACLLLKLLQSAKAEAILTAKLHLHL